MNEEVSPCNWIPNPKTVWTWDVFGGGLMFVNTSFEVPLWRRVLTKVFLGSVWERA